MMFIYKTATFAPVWTIMFKICAIFVHQTLTEHAPSITGKNHPSELPFVDLFSKNQCHLNKEYQKTIINQLIID